MTELRPTARLEAVTPQLTPPRGPRWVLQRGFAGLVLGAGLTGLAVALSNGILGFLSLVVVFGSLAWISLRLIQHFGARFRRRA